MSYFLSPETFRQRISESAFIEHAEVHGNMYGTLKAPMEAIEAGKVYIVEIDVQGALQLKALQVEGVYVFVAPPDFEVLRQRLSGRGPRRPRSSSAASRRRRTSTARGSSTTTSS